MTSHAVLLAAALYLPGAAPAAGTAEPLTFEKHVRPILKAYCFECHGEGERLRGSLDLRLARTAVAGGDSGPALTPGQPAKSLLLERVRKQEMPPGQGKLQPEQVAVLERWVAEGAKTAAPEPEKLAAGFHVTDEERSFWSFQPIRRPAVPAVKDPTLVQTPVDAFLLAKLEAQGLTFSPEADRPTLIRRASFDLLGLPPTPAEVDAFVNDPAPDAYEKLIDRLLDSPHYGERWGRHWLDVAGYADSEGYSADDAVRKYAWKYRDYVVRAVNADRPWDEFLVEQLAGDELVRPPYGVLDPAGLEKLVATGFLRMAPDGTGSPGVEQPVARNQVVADTLQVVGSSLLGLTVHCAQCHNHRYDPIPQTDYYSLRAVLEPAYDLTAWRAPAARDVALFSAEDQKKAAAIEAEAAKIDRERLQKQEKFIRATFEKEIVKLPAAEQGAVRQAYDTPVAKRDAAQKKLLQRYPSVNVSAGSLYLYDSKAANELKADAARAAALRATKPVPDYIRALTEVPGKVPVTRLFERGDHEQPKQAVAPAGLTILAPHVPGDIPADDPAVPTTGRRLAFARQLTSGKHPLVPRVLVNRFWLHHFGKGIVATPGDFGQLGERPTHPELLDWLADEFVRGGWKLKRLHKLLMTSTAYRQVATRTPALQQADPDNRLLGRMSVRRLEGEAVRDAALAVSGRLNARPFGPPVPVTVDEEGQVIIGIDTRDGAGRFVGKAPPLNGEEYRRSVYVQVRRSMPLAVLEAFDAPAMTPNCEARTSSTVAPQALMLMNSKLMTGLAADFAGRVRAEAGADAREQARLAWRLAFAADPSPRELDEAAALVREQAGAPQSLAVLCQALLSSNRFLYVD